ncbi:MAG: hypothetical protein AB7O88_11155 [Reyranellaceae bacterium]
MSEARTHPFSRRTLLGLLGVAAAAFVAMAYFAIDDDAPRAGHEAAGTTSASRSAVGYRAFIELLRQFEPQVISRMSRSSGRAALRLLLAPADKAEVRYVIAARTGPVLIVLPKWRTLRDGLSDRVRAAHLLEPDTVRELAREVARDIDIVRPRTLTLRRDSDIRGLPELGHPQLVNSRLLCPLLSAAEGMLIGRLCARPDVIVLADPDLLANHGLWRGENATVAMNLVSRIRGSGPLILALESDAAAAAASRNIWRLAVTPPFLAITIGFAIAAAVALWMAALRFGPPAKDSATPAVGIFTLIDVGAGLLHARSHGGRVLRRYAELQALDLGRRLHAPKATTSPTGIGVWLDASRRRRTPGPGYGELMREVDQLDRAPKADPAAIVATAGRLFRWWEDSLHGR